MATQLDLQEQEQLDALKAFWQRYGSLITWTLTLVLAAFAGYSFWQKHQRDQALQAGTLFDDLEHAAAAADVDKTAHVFDDLKTRYGRTTYALQAGLLAARVESAKGKPELALQSLAWVAAQGDAEYAALAHLRAAGLLMDAKKHDDALKQIDAVKSPAFAALAADRRGDVLLAQGKKDAAKSAYRAAWDGLDASVKYRFVVETKLVALGAAPAASAASASAPASASANASASSGVAR